MADGFDLNQIDFTHSNGTIALQNLTLRADVGEHIAIIGPSGSGKTTLLNLLATAIRPQQGQLHILGVAPWSLSKSKLRHLRAAIGLIHQVPPLPPKQRVITAILAGKIGQWSSLKSVLSLLYPADIAGALHCLTQFDLGDRLFDRCDRLSGGQLQRVGIARVLYQEPKMMLADEPVSALDPVLSERTVQTLTHYAKDKNITFVASLHDVEIALKWFPRMVGLRHGQVLFDLPSGQVTKEHLHTLYASEMRGFSQEIPASAL